jgi:hypothetical protein
LRLAAPNILNLLAFAGVITFLGRIGTNALAGASLAFPWVMMVLQTTNSGMGVGVSSAVARALGAGRRDRADALVFHAFLLALIIAAIFSTVFLLGAPFLFRCGARHRQYEFSGIRAGQLRGSAHHHSAGADLRLRAVAGARPSRRRVGPHNPVRRREYRDDPVSTIPRDRPAEFPWGGAAMGLVRRHPGWAFEQQFRACGRGRRGCRLRRCR